MSAVIKWHDELPVLGIRVRFEATSAALREPIEAAFGVWRGLAPHLWAPSRLTVRFHVHDAAENMRGHAPVQYWSPHADVLFAWTNRSLGFADVARHQAVAHVSRGLVRDTAHFRYTFVEAMTLFLASSLDRAPFHCAAVARHGTVVLLSGRPGVGKSTVAYAALRRGFQVFAEDTVWLQREPRVALWGLVGSIHLSRDAARFFPELRRHRATLLVNGEPKIAVRVEDQARPELPVTSRAVVCLLTRSRGKARLGRIGRTEALDVLLRSLAPGFDRFPGTVELITDAFAARGAWSLATGSDPHGAVALLDEAIAAEGLA